MRRSLLIALLLLMVLISVHGAVIYVNSTNCSTQFKKIKPGDIVVFTTGDYNNTTCGPIYSYNITFQLLNNTTKVYWGGPFYLINNNSSITNYYYKFWNNTLFTTTPFSWYFGSYPGFQAQYSSLLLKLTYLDIDLRGFGNVTLYLPNFSSFYGNITTNSTLNLTINISGKKDIAIYNIFTNNLNIDGVQSNMVFIGYPIIGGVVTLPKTTIVRSKDIVIKNTDLIGSNIISNELYLNNSKIIKGSSYSYTKFVNSSYIYLNNNSSIEDGILTEPDVIINATNLYVNDSTINEYIKINVSNNIYANNGNISSNSSINTTNIYLENNSYIGDIIPSAPIIFINATNLYVNNSVISGKLYVSNNIYANNGKISNIIISTTNLYLNNNSTVSGKIYVSNNIYANDSNISSIIISTTNLYLNNNSHISNFLAGGGKIYVSNNIYANGSTINDYVINTTNNIYANDSKISNITNATNLYLNNNSTVSGKIYVSNNIYANDSNISASILDATNLYLNNNSSIGTGFVSVSYYNVSLLVSNNSKITSLNIMGYNLTINNCNNSFINNSIIGTGYGSTIKFNNCKNISIYKTKIYINNFAVIFYNIKNISINSSLISSSLVEIGAFYFIVNSSNLYINNTKINSLWLAFFNIIFNSTNVTLNNTSIEIYNKTILNLFSNHSNLNIINSSIYTGIFSLKTLSLYPNFTGKIKIFNVSITTKKSNLIPFQFNYNYSIYNLTYNKEKIVGNLTNISNVSNIYEIIAWHNNICGNIYNVTNISVIYGCSIVTNSNVTLLYTPYGHISMANSDFAEIVAKNSSVTISNSKVYYYHFPSVYALYNNFSIIANYLDINGLDCEINKSCILFSDSSGTIKDSKLCPTNNVSLGIVSIDQNFYVYDSYFDNLVLVPDYNIYNITIIPIDQLVNYILNYPDTNYFCNGTPRFTVTTTKNTTKIVRTVVYVNIPMQVAVPGDMAKSTPAFNFKILMIFLSFLVPILLIIIAFITSISEESE